MKKGGGVSNKMFRTVKSAMLYFPSSCFNCCCVCHYLKSIVRIVLKTLSKMSCLMYMQYIIMILHLLSLVLIYAACPYSDTKHYKYEFFTKMHIFASMQ
jgi:hypothetical protein